MQNVIWVYYCIIYFMKCPNCGFENPVTMKFCGMCGEPIAQNCTNCGTLNPIAFRFCGNCGSPLAGGTTRAAVQLPLELPGAVIEPAAGLRSEAGNVLTTSSIRLDGERKVVSVVMTDVTGSTNLLEQVGNETWVELMNQVLYTQEREVERFGGRVDQFRGDGLVAFFGADVAHEDDPERAILASLSMHKAVQSYLEKQAGSHDIALQLRVGVNTGEVILMDGVGGHHGEDTAMGVAISIASRMETSAEPGTVLVSEYTHQLVTPQFSWQALGEIMVKGVSQPIKVYRPLEPLAAEVSQLYMMGSLETAIPMIGRDKEFEVLSNAIEGLYEGRGAVILISGEAGIGKSFLINEVQHYFNRQVALRAASQDEPEPIGPSLAWLHGRCRSYNVESPYSVWADLLQGWLGEYSPESGEALQEKLYREFSALFGDRVGEYYPYLAAFLSLPLEDAYADKVKHLGAEGLQRQFFRTVRAWLAAIAAVRPIVLGFSDTQWADSSSLELLKACLPLTEDVPILWILTYRPDRTSPAWEFQHYVETQYPHRLTLLELSPLTYEQCQTFITTIFGEKALPEGTQQLIYKNSEGNPYYILELLRSLIENGSLVRDSESETWKMPSTLTTLNVPASLHGLLQARIDGLSQDERHVLQLASVVGTTFWFNVLESLVAPSFPLKQHLGALQRANLIFERSRIPQLGMEYSFNTKLVRDAAYEGLLTTQLSAYHLKVAEYFEQELDPLLQKQHEGMIAYHYRRAGNPNKELFYTMRAAERAMEVYANAEALEHCQRALLLLDEMVKKSRNEDARYVILTQRFEVLNLRHRLYYVRGNMEAGDADAKALLPLARKMKDDPAWLVDALLEQPEVRRFENKATLDEGFSLAEQALNLALQLGDKHREMNSLIIIGSLYLLKQDHRWQEIWDKALVLSRELGDTRAEANLLIEIGSAYGIDSLDRNQEYLQAALQVSQKLDDKRTELRLLSVFGAQFERNGDYYRWLTEFEQPRLNISRQIGDRIEEGFALMHSGQIKSLYLGDYTSGLVEVEESLRITESLTSRLYPLLRLIQIQMELGKYPEAQANLEVARPISEQAVNYIGRAGYSLVAAILYSKMGGEENFNKVLEITTQVIELVNNERVSRQYAIGAFCIASAAHLGLAALSDDEAVREDHLRQALDCSQRSLDFFNQFSFVQIIECSTEGIFFQHSQALAANRRKVEAREMVERSYGEMMRKYEMIPASSPYRKTFLDIHLHQEISQAAALP